MYTIQHKDPVTRTSKMQDYDARDLNSFVRHLAAFPHEIFNVFENGNLITKRIRSDLVEAAVNGVEIKSEAAKDFVARAFMNHQ